jgi:hypothetical protein
MHKIPDTSFRSSMDATPFSVPVFFKKQITNGAH